MTTTVNRWGTGYGIRITKAIAEMFPVSDKEKLNITADNEKLIITRAKPEKTHKKLEDYLVEYGWDGETYEPEKIEWGTVGEEIPW